MPIFSSPPALPAKRRYCAKKKGHAEITQGAPESHSRRTNSAIIAAVSRPVSAVRRVVSFLPALAPRAAGAVVPVLHVALPQVEQKCVAVANDRPAEESPAAEQAHSGWTPVDWARLPADGSVPLDCSAALSADGSSPAGCSTGQAGWAQGRCSLDARRAHSPRAELPHDWPEGYKALQPLSPARLPGR